MKPRKGILRMVEGTFVLVSALTLSTRAPAQENPHTQQNLNCEGCHVTTSWTEIRFNHSRTSFPLEGRHKEEDCLSCHRIENFSKVESDCFSCHQDVHQAKMGNDCERCHSFRGWEIFDVEEIHANSQFPLMGQHSLIDCQSCHQNQQQGDFALMTTDCISCHQQDYLGSENPNHVANAFSTTCQECHGMNDWRPAYLPNHDAFFPIFAGAHDGAWSDCAECHTNPVSFSEFSCLNCHAHEQPQMDEEHQGIQGYAYESGACLSCHPTGEQGDFKNHDAQFFPIFTGTHAGTWDACLTCHTQPGNRKEFTCVACHEHGQSEMDAKHAGISGYAYDSHECLLCHPTGEKGEFKEHDNLYFPIFSGEHAGAWSDCLTCHPNSADRKEFTCIDCHEHRQEEMDPKHAGISGYAFDSNQCYLCHPTGTKGEFRDHDNLYFPIFSGEHGGTWSDCTTCHPNAANRQEFTCVSCHEHSQAEMDPKHSGISGYTFDSNECYACHPNGQKGEFKEHDNLYFPIFSGAHGGQWSECLSCHPNPGNRMEYTCVDCHEHSQGEMDPKHSGISGYAFESSQCYFCHPDGEKGDFVDHDNLYFPIFSGRHQNAWDDCAICHTDPADRKVFSCLDCHEHSRQRMDNKHLGEVNNYVYESSACYECHPDGRE